ncbi:hypothetical protein BJ875DRAFT_499792 [Amylocarpus encephaloides]|uniref:NACHT domain-containing protein n=1 Tax=Amylocarpus encephaloides TaxID=45428 RepID=A0A9P7YAA3_9HELO|nr:hypothetical protein BJ875DRAFT_499792 [Amylocarpus encephaloides]
MRLLVHSEIGRFTFTKEFTGDDQIPPYAILSHTWGPDNEEVTFEDIVNETGDIKPGYEKIRFCGEQARQDGLQCFWIDTCCINKKNNAELSRSINAMFRWYQNAAKCYVYLSDVSTRKRKASDRLSEHIWEKAFRESRWFTRGWTLQELLAPDSVEFFSREGEPLGDKSSLRSQICEITNIPHTALRRKPLSQFSVEERLRWIQHRQTKLEEDKAYSLLGIFDVYVLPIYGEGAAKAYARLLDEFHKMQKCIEDLRLSDPRDDKKRIEDSKGGLLEGLYDWILQNSAFEQWRNDQQSRLLWIKGDPGKGKTMLLCGVINELKKSVAKSTLLSYFFCQATDSRINNATAVLRGLIYLLVDQQPSLISHVRKKYEKAGKMLFEDANAWTALSEIFTNILQGPNLNSTCLIVDGLDECIKELPKLLDLIVQTSAVSPRIKWIVSSRNWPSIEKSLDSATQKLRLCLELNETSVSAAITTFIKSKVDWLATRNGYSNCTRDTVQQHLTRNANSTFLWVALVCQELSNISGWKVPQKLAAFPPGLDALYQRMIDQIKDSEDAELCKDILAVVSTVYRPVTLDELVAFVDMPNGVANEYKALSEIIGLCGSFLTLREYTVSFIHQSAKDFLVERASNDIFPSGSKDIHQHIYYQSLKVMSETLRQNVYMLDHPGTFINNIKPRNPDPLTAVQYSCVYWVKHFLFNLDQISDSKNALSDNGAILAFFRVNFLYWLEALSLNGRLSTSISIVDDLLRVANLKTIPKLSIFLHDAKRFIRRYYSVISSSPLQLYSSALIFTPKASIIRNTFQQYIPNWILQQPEVEPNWNAVQQTLEGHSNWVRDIAFSYDLKLLASASNDKTVKIWDASTGACQQTLKGHSDWVRSIAFSYNSKLLVSASNDKTVKIWDASTGACQQTLEGHSDWVTSIAFSHDSKLLVSASDDKTVKIWNASTGACQQTLKGYSDSVRSVAFSCDSKLLALASGDKTVKIWDASTGAYQQTLEGHSDWVTSIAFSHDSKLLASASGDRTVKIWDASTGACEQTLKGHSGWVTSIAFSHDSELLASASDDKTVKIWDASTGAYQQTLEGHRDSVRSVAFSHDSKLLASASDDETVKIWDVSIVTYEQTLEGHSGWVTSIAFSHDSKLLASASNDKTVKIWDASTGAYQQTLEGHSGWVTSIAFSHDSELFVNGNTIKVDGIGFFTRSQHPQDGKDDTHHQGLGLKDSWVTFNTQKMLWLPPDYRSQIFDVSPSKSMIGIGFLYDNLERVERRTKPGTIY